MREDERNFFEMAKGVANILWIRSLDRTNRVERRLKHLSGTTHSSISSHKKGCSIRLPFGSLSILFNLFTYHIPIEYQFVRYQIVVIKNQPQINFCMNLGYIKEEKQYYDDMKHDYDGFVKPKKKKKKVRG